MKKRNYRDIFLFIKNPNNQILLIIIVAEGKSYFLTFQESS